MSQIIDKYDKLNIYTDIYIVKISVIFPWCSI